MNAWLLFDEAVAAPLESRPEQLRAVLLRLDRDNLGNPADRAELSAAVQCVLVSSGVGSLKEAVKAVDAAMEQGRTGWPNYYLATAAIRTGEYELALARLAHIPGRFFDEQELMWRTVHSWELAAIADLELGHQAEGAGLVNRISNALATRGDADELPAPIDLVVRLLSRADQGDPLSRDLLDVVASSIDTSVWFSDSLSKRIQAARAGAFHGATGKPGAPVRQSTNLERDEYFDSRSR